MNKKQRLQRDIEDVIDLRTRLGYALKNLRQAKRYSEGEVQFRYNAIDGILIIMLADVTRLQADWQKLWNDMLDEDE